MSELVSFRDSLYGSVEVPQYLLPALRMPEFVRLRGVGLSNVDSYEFKDLSASRWAHGVAVASLAWRCAQKRGLSQLQEAHLVLAALLHDVATPPFAHTAEYVISDFDHAVESRNILAGRWSEYGDPSTPVHDSNLPQFEAVCRKLRGILHAEIDRDLIAETLCGGGELGWLIAGTLDLDNADNVVRASLQIGLDVDRSLPIRLADWLAVQEGPVLELGEVDDPDVVLWCIYRSQLYGHFYESSEEELGRQAFLQHLMRRGLAEGVPRHAMLWATDEGLLQTLGQRRSDDPSAGRSTLAELVHRYRSLETAHLLVRIGIVDPGLFRELSLPAFAAWLEEMLQTNFFEPFVMVAARRGGMAGGETLFGPELGQILVFRLGTSSLTDAHLPLWLQDGASTVRGRRLAAWVSRAIEERLADWVALRPWLAHTTKPARVKDALSGIGDWSFRSSTNENIHPYPSTFVHAIPAALLAALGLRGELVVDPFGGTGQTLAEAVKGGGTGVSADSSFVATVAARARFEYLPRELRESLRLITERELLGGDAPYPREIPDWERWHHPQTFEELSRIHDFILPFEQGRELLLTTFSAILANASGRRGEQHGFFADNTPLPRGVTSPPYVDAARAFVRRLRSNISVLERFYLQIERAGRDPQSELRRARVVRLDVTDAAVSEYGVDKGSVAGIVTSPPYLGMADYSLGNRLSYYWLAPEELEVDFAAEIGARRRRFRADRAVESYQEALRRFALLSSSLCRTGGYLAMVLGQPTAKAFEAIDVLGIVDEALGEAGFEPVWSTLRDISWSRNFRYRRLRRERVSVHRLV